MLIVERPEDVGRAVPPFLKAVQINGDHVDKMRGSKFGTVFQHFPDINIKREREREREPMGMLTTRPQCVIAAEGGKGVKEVCNGVRLFLTNIFTVGKNTLQFTEVVLC